MRRIGFKRTLAAVLALVSVLALFAGCKGKGSAEEVPDYVYVPEYVQMPKEITDMYNSVCIGDTIYFISNVAVDEEGNIVSQDEIDAYYKQMEEFYNSNGGGRGPVVYKEAAMTSTATDVDDTADEATDDAAEAATDDVTDEAVVSTAPDSVTLPADMPVMPFSYENRLCSVKIDGTGYRHLDQFEPLTTAESQWAGSNINRIVGDAQGNIWLLENTYETIFDLPEGFDETTEDPWEYYVDDVNEFFLRKIDENGAVVLEVNISDTFGESDSEKGQMYVNSIAMDKDGNVYIDDGNQHLYVLAKDGELICKLDVEGWVNGIVTLGDGRVVVNFYEESSSKQVLKEVDVAAKTWGESYTAPMNAWNFSDGGDDYDFSYNDGSSFYGYDIETGIQTKIITWINNDIDGNNIQFCKLMDDGNIFTVSYANDGSDSAGARFNAAKLVKTPYAEVEQKTTITLAAVYLDYSLRSAILKFNKSNADYRIEVHDYSEYNTTEDYNAGTTKLSTEIISGKVPDIISVNNLPVKQYAAKGLLEDLYTFIDGDKEIKREDLVPGIAKAMETEGKLLSIASTFNMTTMAGSAEVLGQGSGWTVKEMQEIFAAHPDVEYPLGQYMSRDNILMYLCMLNMEEYINWSNGKCSFDSEEFKSLMEFAKSFPEAIDYGDKEEPREWVDESVQIANGQQLAMFVSLYDVYSFQYNMNIFGENGVFKGLPGAQGGGSVANIEGGLAMTTSCKNKEAAWEFMRVLLTEQYQKDNTWSLPTNKNVLESKIQDAMKQEYYTDENGEKQPLSMGQYPDATGQYVDYYAMTQEQADKTMELINSVKYIAQYDTSIMEIVQEQAAAFFDGTKSVDETAKLIQSRVSLYVNEQR